MSDASERALDPGTIRAVFSAMPQGLAVLDGDGRIVHLNPAARDLLAEILPGAEAPVGRLWDELLPYMADTELARAFEDVLAGRSDGVEFQGYRSPRGRYWDVSLKRLEDGALVVFNDVTGASVRPPADEELRLVRQAVASLNAGVVIADAREPDHPLIFVNDGFTRITGYPAQEVLGRNCRFLQGAETDPSVVAEVGEAVREGRPVQRTLLNYRKDGVPFWNRLTIDPVQDEDGVLTHLIGIQEDVTERRRLGQQLEMSDRLNSVGRLAGGIAHDLRNVLAGAKALLQLSLDRDDLPPAVVEDLHEAETVLSRGESVTSQLLAFAREQPMETEVVPLAEVLRNRARFLARFLRDDVTVSAEVEEKLHVAVDLGRLDQVLFNVATNAEQAMPEGGELTFWLRRLDTEQLPGPTHPFQPAPRRSWALVSVADTGAGMDEETRVRAFEPFFTRRDDASGTGLGLASVFGTMEQLGGGVWLHSAAGHGTVVHLAFPAIEPPEGADDGVARAFSLHQRPLTILLAEDDATLRRTLAKALSREGHRVIPAVDGTSALALVEAHLDDLDVIVSDVMMPGVTGVEVVRRAQEWRRDLPALLISGYANEDLTQLGGAVRFLSKPFDLEVAMGVLSGLTADAS